VGIRVSSIEPKIVCGLIPPGTWAKSARLGNDPRCSGHSTRGPPCRMRCSACVEGPDLRSLRLLLYTLSRPSARRMGCQRCPLSQQRNCPRKLRCCLRQTATHATSRGATRRAVSGADPDPERTLGPVAPLPRRINSATSQAVLARKPRQRCCRARWFTSRWEHVRTRA